MSARRAGLSIRSARPEERLALENLQRRASLEQEEYRAALQTNPEAIELPLEHVSGGNCVVAEAAGEVAGFAVILPRDGDAQELEGLFVEPAWQRRGVGRRLLEAAASISVDRQATVLNVVAGPAARGFYARCGFLETGRAETRFGPAILMRLDL